MDEVRSGDDRSRERWQDDVERISLLRLINLCLRNRRLLFVLPVGIVVVTALVLLIMPRQYTSSVTFKPQASEGQLGRISGLASQFGVSVPTGDRGESPEFYAELLSSRELVRRTAVTEYSVPGATLDSDDRVRADLLELLDIEEETRERGVAEAIETIRDRIGVSVSTETGTVRLDVRMPEPGLARDVASRMIDLVNEFNLQTRRSNAKAERGFLEERVEAARRELRGAEDSLRSFLEQNRRWESSPELRFRHDRLERRVSLQQQVYTSLVQSYEKARIDAVRNTPVITVVDPAETPVRPDRRNLFVTAVIAGLLGLAAAFLIAVAREFLRASRVHEADAYEEFTRLRSETAEELGGLWGALRRRVRRLGR